jgi:formylglycine-generating enzyme required for sulfatase activity
MDLIVIALNEDLEGDFFEMTRLIHFSLKRTNAIGMDFVYIPPGKFIMGSPFDEPGRGEDENQKNVTIGNGFFMQTTEVTQAQWMALMERNPSNFDECGRDCPVESVSFSDVQDFIERLNELEETERYRLPTESEWEYATRSGQDGWFCFGSDQNRFPEYGWYKGNAGGHPHPVGQKKPNDWGLYDVHGNVWEWCQDQEREYRLVRGGSWYYPMLFARSANRFFVFPRDRNYTIGFRLVMSP